MEGVAAGGGGHHSTAGMHSLLEGLLLARRGRQGEAAAVGTGVALPARLSREHLGLSNWGVGKGRQAKVLTPPVLVIFLISPQSYICAASPTRLPHD